MRSVTQLACSSSVLLRASPPSDAAPLTAEEEEEEEGTTTTHACTRVGSFELLAHGGSPAERAAGGSGAVGPPPLSLDGWTSFLDGAGRVTDVKALKHRAFHGGLEAAARTELWPLLLGVVPWTR